MAQKGGSQQSNMAQLLVTTDTDRWWYEPIASIRDYSEPDFEEKFHKYANELFSNFYTIKFKYDLTTKAGSGRNYKPDQLLISKNFKKWIIVEVELCKDDLQHTIDQIICFSDPKYVPKDVINYIITNNASLIPHTKEITELINNKLPELLVILDDYCINIFNRLRKVIPTLQICVMEVYRTTSHRFESYRLGGDYPYDISLKSKLEYYDPQTFEIARPKLVDNIPIGNVQILYNMKPITATLIKGRGKKRYLKIPNHNFTKTTLLQLAIDVNSKLIIQTL
jgi:hypothetical protein